MGIKSENSARLKEQKLQQILHCQRVRPWLKSTGPKTPEGKLKVARNLPQGKGEVARIAKGLIELDQVLQKFQRTDQRTKRRQEIAIAKLEKLAAKKGKKSPKNLVRLFQKKEKNYDFD